MFEYSRRCEAGAKWSHHEGQDIKVIHGSGTEVDVDFKKSVDSTRMARISARWNYVLPVN